MKQVDHSPGTGRLLSRRRGRTALGSGLFLGTLLLILIAALAALTTALTLNIQAGVSAYIVGEGYWSKAQQEAVFALYRYSHSGEAADLERARRALGVPLGDHAARLALEQSPPDLAAAREGFLRGGNASEDVARMIWMFRWFANAPYFGDALAIWKEADSHLLELGDVTDELEAWWSTADAGQEELERLRERVDRLDGTLRPLEVAFSSTLVNGSRWLRVRLLLLSAVAFLLMAALAIRVLVVTRRRIRDSESRFRLVFRNAATGMASLDAERRFAVVNDALATLLRYPADALLGIRLEDLAAGEAVPSVEDTDGAPLERELRRGDGSRFWARCSTSAIRDSGGGLNSLFVIIEDVSEARRRAEELQHMATHDGLTGLLNRREIECRLAQALEQAGRDGSRHVLGFIDLDDFKRINDSCGHAAGDVMLRDVARSLRQTLRPEDSVGRLGGDEFAALLLNIDLEAAVHVARKMIFAVGELQLESGSQTYKLSCSVGLVVVDRTSGSLTTLLHAADKACYVSKQAGRSCVAIHKGDGIELR